MEPLSIINPPIINLNDPRVTSENLLKTIDEQERIITKQMADLSAQVKKGDVSPFDVMMFACVQHHLHVTTLNTKLTARQVDLVYMTTQLSFRLERLTKWLIGLTVVLAIFTLPLVIEVISRWIK